MEKWIPGRKVNCCSNCLYCIMSECTANRWVQFVGIEIDLDDIDTDDEIHPDCPLDDHNPPVSKKDTVPIGQEDF